MIENKVVFLRKINQKDHDLYTQIYTNEKLMEFVSPVLSGESAKRSFDIVLRKMSLSPPTLLLYVIQSKTLKSNIGVIGLRWNPSSNSQVEVGVIVLSKFQRHGFAHHSKSLLMNYAFQKFPIKSIFAICDKDNRAANKANKKLGFIISNQINKQNNQEKIVWTIKK